MKDPGPELDSLLARLRAEPPPPAAARVAQELPWRVTARLAADPAGPGLLWFWRWSAVLGGATLGVLGWAGVDALDYSHQLLAQADPTVWLLSLCL